MNRIVMPLFSLALAAATLPVATTAFAADYKVGSIEIDQPWSRATPKGAKVAGGYLTIKNTGSAPDRLVGGTFAGAGSVSVHEMSMEGGVMKMREMGGGLEIKPGATVELRPGGNHLMLMDMSRSLDKGDRVKGTLVFEKAGTVDIEYAVEAPGATPKQQGGQAAH